LCHLSIRRPPCPTLFPYTTLFRSITAFSSSSRTRHSFPFKLTCLMYLRFCGLTFRSAAFVSILIDLDVYFGTIFCVLNSYVSSRSEEHTSELQSRFDLVCRLLLEK